MMREDVFNVGIKGLICNQAGKILLLQTTQKHANGSTKHVYWNLPGGRIERGSTAEETLQREISEELGITGITDIQPVGMMLTDVRIPIGGDETVGLILGVYSCSLPEGAQIRLSDEHTDFGWFAAEEVMEMLEVKYPREFFGAVRGSVS